MDRTLNRNSVDVLQPFTYGDLFYADTTTSLVKLPVGSESTILNIGAGAPAWTSTPTLSGLTVTDSLFNVVGNGDPTKRLNFQTDTQATLSRLTFDVGAQTANRTLTVPVLTANATLATISQAQSFTGIQTFADTTDSTSKDTGSIVTEGGAGFEKTVYVGDLLRVLGSSGTNTVIEAGSNSKATSTYINMNAAAGQTRAFTFQSGGSFRWLVSCSNTAESGSDAGSNFAINAYTDAGGFIDTPLTIARLSGGTMTLVRPMTLSTASNGLTIAKTTGTTLTVSSTDAVAVNVAGGIKSIGATQGIGYATGAGGTVTQITSRTTGVTLNKVCGQITLFSAAGSATWQSFTVTNSAVATTDTIIVNQDSGTDKYMVHVTAVGAGSFEITYATTGGTTTEQPVFNFSVIKAVTA